MLPTVRKDVVPTKQQNMVVYQYMCRCDCRYVGRTSQRLQDRIKQHIPKTIRNQAQLDRDLFQFNSISTLAIASSYRPPEGDKQKIIFCLFVEIVVTGE